MVNAPATFNQAYYKGRQWPGPCTWPNTEIFPVYTGICRVTFSNGNISYGKYVDGNCGSVDATLAKVEVLGIVDGCGTPEGNKWSDCSVSCGFGTSTKGDQNRDCHALCETEAVRYCNLPMMPNDLMDSVMITTTLKFSLNTLFEKVFLEKQIWNVNQHQMAKVDTGQKIHWVLLMMSIILCVMEKGVSCHVTHRSMTGRIN